MSLLLAPRATPQRLEDPVAERARRTRIHATTAVATRIPSRGPSETHLDDPIDDQGPEDDGPAVAGHHHEGVASDPSEPRSAREGAIESEVGVGHDDTTATDVDEEAPDTLECVAHLRVRIACCVASDTEMVRRGHGRRCRDRDHDRTAGPRQRGPRVGRRLRTPKGEPWLTHPAARDSQLGPGALAPGTLLSRDPPCRDDTGVSEARLDAASERTVVSRTSRS